MATTPFNGSRRNEISKESSIYHYTLVQKFRLPPEWNKYYLYSLILLVLLIVLFSAWYQVWLTIPCYLIIQLLHVGIMYLSTSINRHVNMEWKWYKHLPWTGLMPKKYISFTRYKHILLQILFIGLAFILFASPWIKPVVSMTCLFLHIWILVPKLILIWINRNYRDHYMIVEQNTVLLYRS